MNEIYIFVCDFTGNAKPYKYSTIVIEENVFLYLTDKKIYLNFGEIHFSPIVFEAKVGNTNIYVKNNFIFWLNEDKFGFGYPTDSCFIKDKIIELVKDHYCVRKNEIKKMNFVLTSLI